MRIGLSAGHNVYNNGIFDNGSVANGYKEADITKKTVAMLLKNLKDKGYIVKDITPYNQKFRNSKEAHLERSRRVRNFNPDLYLDIHINAGGGTGPETIVYSAKSKAYPYARKIVNSIASNTKLRNRGVKVKRGYWSVSLHPQPSIIIEGGFIDSPNNKDMRVLTPIKYANSISKIFPNLNKTKPKKTKGKEVNNTMTEKEVRKIVREEIEKLNNGMLGINSNVSDWAKDFWEEGKELKITDGSRPKGFATREEVVTLILRTLNKFDK